MHIVSLGCYQGRACALEDRLRENPHGAARFAACRDIDSLAPSGNSPVGDSPVVCDHGPEDRGCIHVSTCSRSLAASVTAPSTSVSETWIEPS